MSDLGLFELNRKNIDKELNLGSLLPPIIAMIWKERLLFVLTSGMVFTAIFIYALNLPGKYMSEVLLAPVSSDKSSGMEGIASKFSGLAGIAGLSLGTSSVDKTTLAMETLKSRVFLIDFIKRHNILVPVMAASRWNPDTNTLEINENIYSKKTHLWVEKKKEGLSKPTDLEAYKRLSKMVSISKNKETGMVLLTVESLSPYLSKKIAQDLVKDINDYLRQLDMIEAEKSIKYLGDQLANTSFKDIRTTLYQMIEQQMKTMMLSEVRDGYVFRVVDPAMVSDHKSSPSRLMLLLFGIALSVLAGFGAVMIKITLLNPNYINDQKRP